MLGTPLDRRVRRTLAVALGDDLALSLDDTPTSYFAANLAPPSGDNSTFDGSPRTGLTAWRLRWAAAPDHFSACDRIEVPDDDIYELIADPAPVTNGRHTIGFSAPALPVALLYPRVAELRMLGGDDVLAEVRCAVFQGRESSGQRTTYTDTFCELEPAAWEHIVGVKKNQTLHFSDGAVWKLSSAALGGEVPFVAAQLRKS